MPTWYDASGQPPFPTGYNSVSSGPTPNPNADSRGGQFWYGQDPLRTQAPPQPDPPTPAPPPPPNPRANYTFNPNGWYGGFRFNGPNRFGQHAGQVTSGVQQGALGLPGYDEDRDTMDQAWGSFLAQYGGRLSPAQRYWLDNQGKQALERAYWGLQETDPFVRYTDVLGGFDPTQSWYMLDPRTAGRPTQYNRVRFSAY